MADVYCAIYGDSDYWDGTTHWGIDPSDESWCANQAARDNIYTAAYTSLSAWEAARDGVANAGDDEYAIIYGPWTSHDTNEFDFAGWSNTPNKIWIKTLGTDARSQDGKYGSNSCYVGDNDGADYFIKNSGVNCDIEIEGLQFKHSYDANATAMLYLSNANFSNTYTVKKCWFEGFGFVGWNHEFSGPRYFGYL